MNADLETEAESTERPLGRRDRRRAEMRSRILEAALTLFAKQDYHATTVEQITEAADVGKGTFFNYFSCKEHLLATHSAMILDKFSAALDGSRATDATIRTAIQNAIRVLAEDSLRNPHLERNLWGATFSSPHATEHMTETIQKATELLGSVYAEAQKKGEVRTDLDPNHMARLTVQNFLGASVMWAFDPVTPFPEWLDQCFAALWDGLSAPGGDPA
ncbi:MAG: TetR/AcrR family transcriptional regulator [Candidatus Hydrogenedentes bacterium]|nr:TetR/AcrR family transcriptional regulator [Candidatus Hydrogenedentota bacterium]